MKQTRYAAIALLLALFLHFRVQAQVYTKVKVYYDPSSRAERDRILDLLQIDHFTPEKGSVTTEVNADLIPLLRQNGFRYDVLIPDVVKNLQTLNQAFYAARRTGGEAAARVALEQRGSVVSQIIPVPSAFQVKSTFGGYYSYAEMVTAINTLVSTYPAIAQKITLGTTYGGRDIVCVKISDNVTSNEANEPEVLYLGLQHAREAITGSSMIFFMQYLCQFYYTDSRIKDLVDNRQIYIVPCFNPDGWEYNRTTSGAGGGWRKNRSPQASGQFGVDLNRNWGVDWSNCGSPILGPSSSCGSASSSQETYYGPSAFSEKETQAIRAFVRDSGHHFVVGFDQHSYGPYYSLPYGRKSLHPAGLPALQGDFFTAVPALMGTYNGMRAADSYDALGYEVAGGFKDWMLMGEIGVGNKDTVYALTGEGPAGGGTSGTYGDFWAPASQITYLSQGICYQNLQLAYAAGTYVDIQDTSDIALTSLSGNMGFSIRRLGRGNDPVTVTMIPLENIQTVGSPVTITSMPHYYDTAMRSIHYTLFPGLTNGQRVRFAWKVSTDGYSYTDTVTKFYNPTLLLSDDMEGTFATNWTTTSNVSDKWAFTTLAAFGGTHAMTESPAGNYTTSTDRIVTYKNTFNLTSSTAAFLTFWVKHRAENFRDKLQIQVSTNGTTWTAIAGSTTVQEPGTVDGSTINGKPALTGIRDYWTKELFDLNAYRGTAALRLRMEFTSDGDASGFAFETDDGFYIDNLKVVSTSATLLSLPVTFIDVTAKMLLNNTVDVRWEAATDRTHDYFEVEKSTDGTRFTGIGTVRGGSSSWDFIDTKPNAGHNYYRIREVSIDARSTYSKVADVVYTPQNINVMVYPNPVRDMLDIKLYDNRAPETLDLVISDVQGRIIYRQAIQPQNGAGETKVNVQGLTPQVYILKVADREGGNVTIRKFIKE